MISSSGSPFLRLSVGSASRARTSQAMPASVTRPKSPGWRGASSPKRTTLRCTVREGRPFTPDLITSGGGTMAATAGSSRLITIKPCLPKMRALAPA